MRGERKAPGRGRKMAPPQSSAPCRGFAISQLPHGSRRGLFSSALTSSIRSTPGSPLLCRIPRSLLQFAQHPVFDPVLVPPLAGVDLDAVDLHAEVDVNSAGEAGLAGDAHFLAL